MDARLTEGKPYKVILRFMIPLMIGNICQQLYNLADMVIVGRFLGAEALAAVGSTGTIVFFIIGTCGGMVTGFSIVTSQKYGAGEHDDVRRTFTGGFLLSLILIVVSTLITLVFIRNILVLMNTPEDIFEPALAYISVICGGIFATVFSNFFSSLLRAIGNSRIPLAALVISAVLNVGLDLLFIVRFKMGTAGAAYATVLSQAISAVICVVYILLRIDVLRPRSCHWKTDPSIIKAQLMQGIPMALQTGITASGTMIMQSAINLFGSAAVAAVTASSKIQGVTTMAMFSAGQTMASYVGQNYGYGDFKRIREGVRSSLSMFIVYSIAAGIANILLLPYILPLFFDTGTDMTAYLPWAGIYITECVICYFFLSMIFIIRSSIQAIGHGFAAMIMGISELGARLIMSFVSMYIGSFYVAAAADPGAWIVAALVGLGIFARLLPQEEKRLVRTHD
ncbi:putative efflux protein, MATE family [Ruminococcaceae bacterium YRB3002]|nr:putative efflux protein, MATE family [Ruminococcaceae bacterium YRB3002]